eukprot:scaffold1522_cov174-Ochromonas_danica.AAC.19
MAQRRLCNYLIIGGGPVGSSVAYHLSQAGARNIVVLEKDLRYRHASAMLSAGGIRQQFSVPENVKISIYGAEFIKNPNALAVNGEVPDWQFHENGYLYLSGERSQHILRENHKTQVEHGAHWMKLLDQQALSKKFSWLNTSDLTLGSFGEANEGYFDPWIFVHALKKKNISMGVEYIEGNITKAKMQPVVTGSSDYVVEEVIYRSSSSSSTVGQRNEDQTIHADHVINCAGAWSGRLLNLFCKDLVRPQAIHSIPVVPRKRCIFTFQCKPQQPNLPPVTTPLVIDPTGVYFRPEGGAGGRFLTGVCPKEEDDVDVPEGQEEVEIERVDHALFEDVIWPVLYERVPAFQELKVSSAWAGFYDYNPVDQVSAVRL